MATAASVDQRLAVEFAQAQPEVVARVLERFSPEDASAFCIVMGPDAAAAVLPVMIAGHAGACLAAMEPEQTLGIVQRMATESCVVILRAAAEPVREAVLAALPSAQRNALSALTKHRKGVAGAIMEPVPFVLPEDIPVAEALERVTSRVEDVGTYIYVVDRKDRLVGATTVAELVNSARDVPVASVAVREPLFAEAEMTDRALVGHVGWRRFHALPVVDAHGVLVGRVRHAVLHLMREEIEKRTGTPGGLKVALSLTDLCLRGAATLLGGAGGRAPRSHAQRDDGGRS